MYADFSSGRCASPLRFGSSPARRRIAPVQWETDESRPLGSRGLLVLKKGPLGVMVSPQLRGHGLTPSGTTGF
jgi:hypothetical protein